MEKDYFLDRPEDVMYRDRIPNGVQVFICTKQMQPYAKELKDLNLITVTGNLTTSSIHARGQKVQGEEFLVDKYGNVIINDDGERISESIKGRCTYLLTEDGTAVYTKEGFKYLEAYRNKDGKTVFKLMTEDEITGKYKLSILLSLQGAINFKVPICKYSFFDSLDTLKKEAYSLKIENMILGNGFITMDFNGNKIKVTDAVADINGKEIIISNANLFDYISNNFTSENDKKYSFNRKYKLEFGRFVADEY